MPEPRIHVSALQCPNCGAPAKVHPGERVYTCEFCKTSFEIEGLEPPPPPPPQVQPFAPTPYGQPPEIVVIAPGAGPPARVRRSSGVGCVFPFVFAIAALGAGVYFALQRGIVGGCNGQVPLVCGGNDRITADGVEATFTNGVAVTANDNCEVHLKDVKLKAPLAVRASGNALVSFDHGSAHGGPNAFEVHDNARVTTDRTDVAGATLELRTPRSTPFVYRPPGALVCGENESATLKGTTVRVPSGAAVVVAGNCRLTLQDCHLEAPIAANVSVNGELHLEGCQVKSRVGAYVNDNGRVYVDKGIFHAEDVAFDAVDNARVETRGVALTGKSTTRGNATLRSE